MHARKGPLGSPSFATFPADGAEKNPTRRPRTATQRPRVPSSVRARSAMASAGRSWPAGIEISEATTIWRHCGSTPAWQTTPTTGALHNPPGPKSAGQSGSPSSAGSRLAQRKQARTRYGRATFFGTSTTRCIGTSYLAAHWGPAGDKENRPKPPLHLDSARLHTRSAESAWREGLAMLFQESASRRARQCRSVT